MAAHVETVLAPPVNRRFVLACCISLSLVGFVQAYMGAAMPFVRDSLSLTTQVVAWHFSLYALGRLSSGYIVTTVLRLLPGARAILLFGFCLIGFAALLALSETSALTLPLAYCIGLSGGTAQAVTQTQIGTLTGKGREVALAQALVWAGVGSTIAPLIIGWLSRHGYPWVLVLMIPFLFAVLMLAAGNSPIADRPDAKNLSAIPPISTTVVVFWALVICGNALEWTMGFWGAQYIEITHRVSTAAAVSMMTLFFAGIIIGRLANVYLLRKFDCDVLYVAYVIATGIALSITLLTTNVYVTCGGLLFAGAAIGCLYPNNMSTAMKYAPNEILRITTGAAKCSGLSLLTFPLLMGYLGTIIGLDKAIHLILLLPAIMLGLIFCIRGSRNIVAQ